jgi:hypothetical protein
MGEAVRRRLQAANGVWGALTGIEPRLKHVARVSRASASSSLVDLDGKQLSQGGGHTFILLSDGTRMKEVLAHLHRRCWAVGLSWIRLASDGTMLERSLVDLVVASPERIVNEGPPVVLADIPSGTYSLKVDMSRRKATIVEGDALAIDALDMIPDDEHASRVEALRERNRDKSMAQALRHFKDHDLTEQEREDLAIDIAYSSNRCIALPLSLMLKFKGMGWVSVADVLANPMPYVSPSENTGPVLLDPLDRNDKENRYRARLYLGRTGHDLFIRSWRHGVTYYVLAPEAQEARAATSVGDVEATDRWFRREMGDER